MYKRILFILSTLALLIHPPSLSAQNSFSISLDVDDSADDQGVTSLNVSANQVVAIQIFGNNIQNANGLAGRFEYDASQVTYEGFDAGDVLPNAQALPEQGTGFVEIGIASLGGQATANSGLVGTIRFRATAAFSGTAIRLVRAEISRGGRFETIMPNIRIALQGAPTPASFSLSLDVDGTAGDQAVTSVDISTDVIAAIQIFGQDIRNANGISGRFEYDASQVTYDGFDIGGILPNVQILTEQGTNPGFVQISLVSFGGQATANSGLLGTVRFRTMAEFSDTAIRLVRAELGRSGQIETVTIDLRVELKLQVLTPDFNRDGMVNFADFLAFADQYGARQGDGRYEAKYDLDSDGAIRFGDFLIFGSSFGKEVSTPGGGSEGGSTTNVDIPDANLRVAIEAALGKASGVPISRTDMAGLTRLEAPNKNISDLTGLEFATGLTRLDLGEEWVNHRRVNSNAISNLSPLSGLTKLTSLDLADNAILNVAVLSNLTNLTSLNLNNNSILDITSLSGLTNLTWLNLADNVISDVAALSNLTNLTSLYLSDNSISDVSALSGLTNLEWLNLGNNSISDVAALSNLTNLTSLYLNNNSILDIAPLSGLTNLEWLNLGNNSISNVAVLSNLTNLKSLYLYNNSISDVSALSGLTNLEWLDLGNNSISNVAVLSNLTNLKSLYLYNNSISDVSALSGLTNLEWLDLGNNSISNVAVLSNLTNLKSLYLYNNSISDVSALSGLTNLEWLDLADNSISNVSALSGLTNLTSLNLSDNSIVDISPLVANTGLGSEDRVYLWNNPLSATSLNTHIPNLQARGVTVEFGASKPGVEEIERGMIQEEWEPAP